MKQFIPFVSVGVLLAGLIVAGGQVLKTVQDNTNDVKEVEDDVEALDERVDDVEEEQAARRVDVEHIKKGVEANSKKLDAILEKL